MIAYQYFVNPERFEANIARLQWQREVSSYMGQQDYDNAKERKEMGMGLGARCYHRLRDFITYLRAYTTGRPR